MKFGSTLLLRAAVGLIGLIVLALCVLVLPRGIGGSDMGDFYPLLLLMYVTAIPFFIALYQTLKLLSYVDKNEAFSELSVKALKYIAYCATTVGGLYTLASPYLYTIADKMDAPGVLALGLVVAGASFIIAMFAAVLQKLLRSAIDIQSENDLTV